METLDIPGITPPVTDYHHPFVDKSIPSAKPGSPEWLKYMTASKVAGIMGHSAYDSWFSTYYRMKGVLAADPEDDTMRRGHYLEPAIAAYMADQLPEYEFRESGMWTDTNNPWWGATPDRVLVPKVPGVPLSILECKSAAIYHSHDWEWGEPGSNEIPLGHYDQVQWQLRFIRIHYPEVQGAHVGMISNHLNFAAYYVPFDPDYVSLLEKRVTLFMSNFKNNVSPSIDPMDGHMATYRAIQAYNPDIEPRAIELSQADALRFLTLNEQEAAIASQLTAIKSVIADQMGTAKTAMWNKHKIFGRQKGRNGAPPYMVKSRSLPPTASLRNEIEENA